MNAVERGEWTMGKRPMLSSVCAVVLLLALASSSLVAAAPRAAAKSAPSGRGVSTQRTGWTLTLQGKLTKVLPISKVPAKVTWDGTKAGNINPTLRAKYRGQTLYKLVGLVDDKDPSGFNVALAKKGYQIRFSCLDGYKVTINSATIVGKKKWIVAKLKNGKHLPKGERPFRYVGSFIKPFNGKLSARMLTTIKLIF
jgi:hypothetical protein